MSTTNGARPRGRCQERITNKKAGRYGQKCGRPLPCPVHTIRADEVPVTVMQPIVEEWLHERTRSDGRQDASALELLAAELAAGGHWTDASAMRLLYSIRKGPPHRSKLGVDIVDKMLQALDATDLWQTDEGLAQVSRRMFVEEMDASDAKHDSTCAECFRAIDWNDPETLAVRVELAVGDGRGRRYKWWSLCAPCFVAKAPMLPVRADITGKKARKIPNEDVRQLYLTYANGKTGLPWLVESAGVVQRYGFVDANVAARSLERIWHDNGWPTFPGGVSKRLSAEHRAKKAGKLQGRIPASDLRKMHVLHTKGKKLSINEIARRTYEKYGYANHNTCCAAICAGWKRLGLKARDRIEMVREVCTIHGMAPKHGPRKGYAKYKRDRSTAGDTHYRGSNSKAYRPQCLGTTSKGRCKAHAAAGSDYCYGHDPATLAQRQALWQNRDPHDRPTRYGYVVSEYIEWARVRDRVRELRAAYGTAVYHELGELLGVKWTTVRTWAGDGDRQMSVQRGRQILEACDALAERKAGVGRRLLEVA